MKFFFLNTLDQNSSGKNNQLELEPVSEESKSLNELFKNLTINPHLLDNATEIIPEAPLTLAELLLEVNKFLASIKPKLGISIITAEDLLNFYEGIIFHNRHHLLQSVSPNNTTALDDEEGIIIDFISGSVDETIGSFK